MNWSRRHRTWINCWGESMPPFTDSPAPTGPAPFTSLDDVLQAHEQLLHEVGAGQLTADEVVRIIDFVRRGVAAGAVLDGRDDRATTQGLLNFWTARLDGIEDLPDDSSSHTRQ